MVELNYAKEGTIREKYNVVDGTTSVPVSNGYQQNAIGFGWTNGVYLAMKRAGRRRERDARSQLARNDRS